MDMNDLVWREKTERDTIRENGKSENESVMEIG